MKYYQEITIIKTPDVSPYFIWSKLYTQVHLALVEQAKITFGEHAKEGEIGVSFPEYACFEKNDEVIAILGTKLRVFTNSEHELESLNLNTWCNRLSDYIHIKSITKVPCETKGHLRVKRFRQTKNEDGKTRNFAKKHGKSFDEVKTSRIEHIAKKYGIDINEAKKRYDNPPLQRRPYITLDSLNNKQRFSLEIDQSEAVKPVTGKFSTYGLSPRTTVPHW